MLIPRYAKYVSPSVIHEMYDVKVPWGPVGYITYKRTYARMIEQYGRTEEWYETIERGCNGLLEIGAHFTQEQIDRLAWYWFHLKGTPAGRPIWQLGTDTVRRNGGDSLMNCWHVACNHPIDPFCFAFNELMLGGGVGFNILPEHVYELPPIKHNVTIERVDNYDCDYIVTDNREGWIGLLHRVLESFYFTGKDLRYDTRCIRAKGRPIKGFGGTASGPEELVRGIGMIATILRANVGRKLRPIHCMDIMNIIGSIVVAGNVRRSAEIAIGSAWDEEFVTAKDWSKKKVPAHRQMSNNTVECEDPILLPDFFWKAYSPGNGEAYGLFNSSLARRCGRLIDGENYRPDPNVVGPNPCIPDTIWIHTTEGPRRVAELIGCQFNALVDGYSYPSTDVGFFHSGNKQVYRIATEHGFSTDCTINHEIETPDRGMVPLEDLEEGDEICLHNQNAGWDGPGSYAEGWLLGSLVGDGVFLPETVRLQYWGNTQNVMLDYAKSLLQHIGARSDCGSGEGKLNSTILFEKANQFGIQASKRFGDRVEKASSSFYRGFLSGWFDADGSVQGDSIRLSSSILDNLYIAQRMLARLGIISTGYENRRPAQWKLMPNGLSYYWCEAQHELVISKSNMGVFQQVVGFIDPEKAAKLEDFLQTRTKKHNEKFITRIKFIIPIAIMPVYDCQIYGVHKFDGNGLKLSNCGEIILESHEACNLAEQFLPNIADVQEFGEVAALLLIANKAISNLPCWHPKTNEVVTRNMRIGLSITGFLEAPHLHDPDIFDAVYTHLEDTDRKLSREMGVARSIKLTTVKPSGTLSLLAGCTPGVHAAYSPYYIRRISFDVNDPLVDIAREHGYFAEPKINIDGSRDYNTIVIDFPCKSKQGTQCAKGYSAISQLENQKFLQTHWADNAVSMTCYYRPEELPAIKTWLRENYNESIKTASFGLHSEHGFQQAPYQEITKNQFLELSSQVRPINHITDRTERTLLESQECSGATCPIR